MTATVEEPAHARFSASESKRWLNCAESVHATEAFRKSPGYPGRRSTPAAAEGTAAHTLAAMCLDVRKILTDQVGAEGLDALLGASDLPYEFVDPGVFENWVIDSDDGTMFPPDPLTNMPYQFMDPRPHLWTVTTEMADAVREFVEEVARQMERLKVGREALVIEQRFNLDWLRPEMGGTTDVRIFAWPVEMVIIDYKHGRGVFVPIEGNTQVRYYATGSAQEENWDFEYLTTIIVQPRCPPPMGESSTRIKTYTRPELWDFSLELASGVDRVNEGPGKYPRAVGDWCTFCEVRFDCPAQTDLAFSSAQLDFSAVGSPEVLPPAVIEDDAELGRLSKLVPLIEGWCSAVKGQVELRMAAGRKIPGHKLVRKRSNRALVPTVTIINQQTGDDEEIPLDPREVIARLNSALSKAGRDPLPNQAFFKPFQLLGPNGLEKIKVVEGRTKQATAMRKALKAAVAEITYRPPGGIAVAFDDDPREEVNLEEIAAQDFEALTNDEVAETGED